MTQHRRGRWRRVRAWSDRRPFTTALLVLTLPVAVGFWRVEVVADQSDATSRAQTQTAQQQSDDNADRIAEEAVIVAAVRAQLRCTRETLAAYTEQTRTLRPKANARLNDLFAALDAALAGKQERARRVYERASRENRAYLRYVAHHPVPTLRRACAAPQLPPPPSQAPRPPAAPAAPAPTVTEPGPTVTRTVSRPGLPVVRTVTVPPGKGSAVITTATRTVTRTVTADPVCSIAPELPTC